MLLCCPFLSFFRVEMVLAVGNNVLVSKGVEPQSKFVWYLFVNLSPAVENFTCLLVTLLTP